jgi:hypothetical protein
MSEVKVNKLSPRSGTTVTLGDSGDTFTVPSGVTFDASSGGLAGTLTTAAQPNITSVGTLTSFTSTGIDDNATSTAITIDSSENVGIGTSSPSARFNILESTVGTDPIADSSNFIKLTNSDIGTVNEVFGIGFSSLSGSTDYLGAFVQALGNYSLNFNHSLIFGTRGTSGNATERMRIDSSGNVGIGTTSPDFSGFGSSTSGIQITAIGNNASSKLSGNTSGDFYRITGSGQHWLYGKGAVPMTFSTDSTERMRIDDSGDVGIGTSNPTGKLNIATATSDGINTLFGANVSPTAAGMYVGFNDSDATATLGVYYASNPIPVINITRSDRTIKFMNDASERMRIDSSGNVGIGTSSPQEHLSINVALNDTEGLGLQYSNDTKGGIKLNPSGGEVRMGAFNSTGTYFTTFYSNNVEAMRIDSFGRFVINGDTPDTGAIQTTIHDGNTTYGLTLATVNTSGTQYHQRFLRGGGGGTSAGYITSNSATTIAFNNASDERLKENIENSGSAIQDLKDIQVRQFDWIDNIDTHRDFGFVAQELVNVVPEAVTQGTDELDDNGKPVISWGVDYSHIVPRLVKVCQEQQTKIEDLEARITTLENA